MIKKKLILLKASKAIFERLEYMMELKDLAILSTIKVLKKLMKLMMIMKTLITLGIIVDSKVKNVIERIMVKLFPTPKFAKSVKPALKALIRVIEALSHTTNPRATKSRINDIILVMARREQVVSLFVEFKMAESNLIQFTRAMLTTKEDHYSEEVTRKAKMLIQPGRRMIAHPHKLVEGPLQPQQQLKKQKEQFFEQRRWSEKHQRQKHYNKLNEYSEVYTTYKER